MVPKDRVELSLCSPPQLILDVSLSVEAKLTLLAVLLRSIMVRVLDVFAL
jgi:hypothetical protein